MDEGGRKDSLTTSLAGGSTRAPDRTPAGCEVELTSRIGAGHIWSRVKTTVASEPGSAA
eukprot:CAMPEP_0182916304 /NCGR_PEP_ID=MMETSP0105_2-20130417/857_1 /TAXON_ID=81532 ORGANISM="Acanthoeca-like sp., Strain 10tr" /NCGR_SAMPLE_ID=MMETSP0105_2 /ASSEMBLY_ACC=CAM_ASM_000205 /LENGTH=58 /DNA_ID=CAMNT_0025053239 /DNA_START=1 /DNA_END=173 /DNA_ORIENTATION=+